MSNKCVFFKEKEQKSIDGGITWVDTGRFRKGALVSTQAAQCGSFVTEYRWTKADYVCDNANKYKGYKQQVSHDNGGSWVDTGVVDIGELISSNSKDCGYDEKWFTLTGEKDFICDGAAKYKKKEMKYTRNSGTTWNSFDPQTFEKGDLIEVSSSDCAPPSMKVKYLDNSEKTFYNLTSIDGNTDSNKKNAKEVIIYDGVTKIGNFAFNGCSSLTGITISESVTRIGNSAFMRCLGLTSVTIPESVTSIGMDAFMSCLGLTSVTIPESVTSIEDYAFYGCSNLATMMVKGTTPPALGGYAIPDETTRIYVPADSVAVYKSADGWKNFADKIWAIGYDEKWFTLTGDKDFICSEGSKYKKKEMKYTRNSGTTWNSFDPPKYGKGDLIESNSSVCTGDTGGTTGDTGTTTGGTPSMKVTYTDGTTKEFYNLTSIDQNTDSNKANAKKVEIYNGVTDIGDYAFYGCENLKTITIPESVTSIGDRAFYECEDMNSITINAYNPPKLGGTDVFFDSAEKIFVPASSVDAYKSAYGWKDYASKIQAIPE